MKDKIKGIFHLTHSDRYTYSVVITTFLGIAAADGSLDWRLPFILAANWLSVAFCFMIKDVINAPDDALLDKQVYYNPVSAGDLSQQLARFASVLVALLAVILFSVLGIWGQTGWKPLVWGVSCMVLGLFFVHRMRRFIRIPLLDLLIQFSLFTGLQILSGFFAFQPNFNNRLLFTLLFVVNLSVYQALSLVINDPDNQRKFQPPPVSTFRSERIIHFIMILTLSAGMISGVITIFFLKVILLEIFALMGVLTIIFMLPLIKRIRQKCTLLDIQEPFYRAVEKAAALSLFMQFIIPSIIKFFR
jgi:energy-converting hydrogenase Eha subunit C